jgi:hypothetical protein
MTMSKVTGGGGTAKSNPAKQPKLTGTVRKIFLFALVRPHTASGEDIFINEVLIPEGGTRVSFDLVEDQNGQEIAINVELLPRS